MKGSRLFGERLNVSQAASFGNRGVFLRICVQLCGEPAVNLPSRGFLGQRVKSWAEMS